MMQRFPWELVIAVVIAGFIVAVYAAGVLLRGVPEPGGPVGHTLGVVGFLLMLGAETLYTMRKRLRRLTVGSMRTWLRTHIVFGIVGPVLVMLHSAGKLSGLAGVLTLLTGLMVLSGFVGRYIYTAAPRSLDGTEVGPDSLDQALADYDHRLQGLTRSPNALIAAVATEIPPAGWRVVLMRSWMRRRYGGRVRQALRGIDPAKAKPFEEMLMKRYVLWMQVQSLVATRKLLALWHLFHIPLGAVLFTLASVHIVAALYYSTFLK